MSLMAQMQSVRMSPKNTRTSRRAGFEDGQADFQVVSSPSSIKELGSGLGLDLELRLGKLESSFYPSLSPNSVDLHVVFFSEWLVIFA